jgi:hypothetical protein
MDHGSDDNSHENEQHAKEHPFEDGPTLILFPDRVGGTVLTDDHRRTNIVLKEELLVILSTISSRQK